MSAGSTGRPRKPSNHYKHGLTSRARAQEWFEDAEKLAEKLAEELIRGAPRTLHIVETATSLSGLMLLLRAIRKQRRRLLTTPPPPKGYEAFSRFSDFEDIKYEILHGDFVKEAPDEPWARSLISYAHYEGVVDAYVPTAEGAADLMGRQEEAFHRIDEYERRARSRMEKLVRRLDFLVLEEKRKAAAAGKVRAG